VSSSYDESRPVRHVLCVIGKGGSRARLTEAIGPGFDLEFVQGTVGAERHLRGAAPDAAVIDCPGDSRQATRVLDALRNGAPDAACVVIEAAATTERVEETLDCGADALLVEPLPPGQLGAALIASLRARSKRRAARDYLANYRARIEEMVDQSPVPMFVKDRVGRYRHTNRAFHKYVGLPPERVIGRRDSELLDAESAADLEAMDRRILETGCTYEGERCLNFAGEDRIYLANKFPFRSDDGEIVGIVGVALDITERKTNEAIRAAAALEQRRLIEQLRQSRAETVDRLTFALLKRDVVSGEHISRMAVIAAYLAELAGLDRDRVLLLRAAAPMHDVGKIAISDHILQKPGPLTMEERAEMERHARIGFEILDGSSSEALNLGAMIALTHHENWDGSGYPRGLRGIEIPIEGRICAVADVFDALLSDRPYRPAMSRDEVHEIIAEGRGRFFDPELIDLLFEHWDEALEMRADPTKAVPAPPLD
jgi:putative two-component system response regulator